MIKKEVDSNSSISSSKESENKLLICCSKTDLSPKQIEFIFKLLSKDLDWKYIILVSSRNGVFPLLISNLLNFFSESIPSQVKDQISQIFQTHVNKNFLLTRKLIEIIKVLKKENIDVLPFKGPTLAIRAYNDISLRYYCDLDILVKPKDFDRAIRILTKNGYNPVSETSWLKRKTLFFTHKKDVVLIGDNGRVQIELHWKLSGSHFSMPLEINRIWRQLDTVHLGGNKFNVLPFEDLFIYLCLHGSRHEWERLSWICDLRELIINFERSGKKVDWENIKLNAKKYGCEKVVELGLFLVNYFFDEKMSCLDIYESENNPSLLRIAEQVEKRIFSTEFTTSLKADKYMYLLSLQEKKSHRIKFYIVYLTYYFKLILTPNNLDKSTFPLPSFLFPLYFILRPIRLLLTYYNSKFTSKSLPEK